MDRDHIHGMMAGIMMESINPTLSTVLEHILGQMDVSTLVSGKMGSSMAKVNLHLQLE